MNDEENQPQGAGTRPGNDLPEPGPAEVEPTNNSSGAPVDLEQVEAIEEATAHLENRHGG